jgi:hypothetical protein
MLQPEWRWRRGQIFYSGSSTKMRMRLYRLQIKVKNRKIIVIVIFFYILIILHYTWENHLLKCVCKADDPQETNQVQEVVNWSFCILSTVVQLTQRFFALTPAFFSKATGTAVRAVLYNNTIIKIGIAIIFSKVYLILLTNLVLISICAIARGATQSFHFVKIDCRRVQVYWDGNKEKESQKLENPNKSWKNQWCLCRVHCLACLAAKGNLIALQLFCNIELKKNHTPNDCSS